MNANRILFTLFCVIILGLAGGCGSKLTQKDREMLLSQAVLSLRQTGLQDIRPALDQFATPEAAAKFAGFNQKIWDFADPKVGWSYFLNTSIIALGNASGKEPVVAFYHPWSDVFLLTSWKVDQNGPKITDAEMLMGDFVRRGGAMPLDPSPLWVRARMFKPLAVGLEAGQSVRAFETLYPAAIKGGWREQIPNLDDRELVEELNYAGASLLLARNVAEIQEFSVAGKPDDARLGAIRKETARLLDAGRKGKLEAILKGADETIPAAKNALLQIPPGTFATYQPVSFLLGEDACVVFLAPTGSADYFVSCIFKGKGAKQKLARLDLVSYAVMYQEGPAYLAGAEGGS
jgi:hypothetical protein